MYFKVFILLFFSLFSFAKDEVSFTKDVKPILDKRCVVCHSCYNSPCQVKLSSIDGINRGGTKTSIYDNRIDAIEPTRLFIDAMDEKGWREKGFYSILQDNENSLMAMLLSQKQKYPISKGDYAPETDKLACSKDMNELNKYLKENPYHGMPYGFPSLPKDEHNTLVKWLENGSKDDTVQSKYTPKDIKSFEEFFNKTDIKHQITARYIYEHLYLAHIKFPDSNDFYELIRSYDKDGKNPVKTRLPYLEPKGKFYYKFRKITSTIVHKTHMVYKLDKAKLKRYEELFIKPNWNSKPHLISYDSKISANPITAYKQIPAISRYNFLLDDVHYIIMTFIRGPVCKGQIALNVINDHFWVAFKDPKYDLTLNKEFLENNEENLSLPNEYGVKTSLIDTFDFYLYDKVTVQYYKNKNELYKNTKQKMDLETIWKGNNPNGKENDAILTVYRHFDSASVHKGALGDIPRTIWVIDYPLLERLYYSLVAGFDVFGSTQHKILVRKYMDRLRIEGESNFLEYLPKAKRDEVFKSWYQGLLAKYVVNYTPSQNATLIKYKTANLKDELANKILSYTNTSKDSINYIEDDYKQSPILDSYTTKKQIETTLKDLTLFDSVKNFREFSSTNFNLMYIRFKMEKEDLVYSVVINRWHDNVAFMFVEDERLDSKKDTINIIEGFVGSYPNYFIEVEQKDISKFFKILKNYTINEQDLSKYFILRSDDNFWKSYDWFQNEFDKSNPVESGLFDLNRYYQKTFN